MRKVISRDSFNDSYKQSLYSCKMDDSEEYKLAVGRRIYELLEEKNGGNMSELAAHFGLTPQSVQQWVSGKTTPNRKRMAKLANFLDSSTSYILFGETDEKNQIKEKTLKYGPISDDNCLEIPQYDTRAAMGDGLFLPDQPGVIQSWTVSKEWINNNITGRQSTKDLCIVTGFGDSMRPLFNPGDPLLVDTSVNTVEFDGVYFFRVENEGFIKRLQRIPKKGILVISENKKQYESWMIEEDMDFQVLGRVLKVWCSENF